MLDDQKCKISLYPIRSALAAIGKWVCDSSSDAILEDDYRDEFESQALASGEFKGVRFTRLADGKYASDRLESTWRSWVTDKVGLDRAI